MFARERIIFISLSLFVWTWNICASKNNPKEKVQGTEEATISKQETKLYRAPLPTNTEIQKLPRDGGNEFNRLIFENSPYLLQHARNPIDWYPWGAEAFEMAQKLDRPVFLSIGYTTCHWCHVMEHESFEDREVADLINRDYICIKVDREERPDIDHVYMSVTQMMTGRGGWPMTVIMSPDKVPFFAGTYFPKSSMLKLLPHFAKIWKDQKGKAKEVGQAIIKSLGELQNGHAGGDLNSSHLDACYKSLKENYDKKFGGFGKHPKFPTCHTLSFLLRYYQRSGDKDAIAMVEHTLKNIRLGGIYDHIGYGIHRYSTDAKWLVPHFEKMLYDQALFAIANLECYLVSKDTFYLRSCRNTLEYVSRKLTSEQGGFFSAEDADSEGEEGKFYLWTEDELTEILGKEDASFYAAKFQFQSLGNYNDEVTQKITGKNIPHLPTNQISAESERERKIRKKLFAHREKRMHPQLDDKILTDWNGLMISAFARTSRGLGDTSYLSIAKKAADFCLSNLRSPEGKLLKRWRQGKAGLPAHLEDYAFFIQGLIDLYEASFESKYLKHADELTKLAIALFEDKNDGGFFLTAEDAEKLLVRPKEIYDGAIPSGNSVMALNLARLSKITTNSKYEKKLSRLFFAFAGFVEKNPQGAEVLLHALDFMLASPLELVVAGDSKKQETQIMLREINRRFLPSKVLLFTDTSKTDDTLLQLVPFLENQKAIEGKATFYACQNQTCDKPRTELQEVIKFLDRQTK